MFKSQEKPPGPPSPPRRPGIVNTVALSQCSFEASLKLTSTLVDTIAIQDNTQLVDIFKIMHAKKSIQQSNREHQEIEAQAVYDKLNPQLKRCVNLAKEKGASLWLSVLPLDDHGFSLHKGGFRDTICLWYGWMPPNIPAK